MICNNSEGCCPDEMEYCDECPSAGPARQQTIIPEEIHTYPAMNERIKEILALPPHDNPMNLYILARIKELEAENEALKKRVPPEEAEDEPLDQAEQDRLYRDVLCFIGRFTTTADGTGYRQEVIEAFTRGGCYWFAFILCNRFMLDYYEAEIVIDPTASHFGCRIGGKMVFDVTGEVTNKYKWVPWGKFAEKNGNQQKRIIEQCIMF